MELLGVLGILGLLLGVLAGGLFSTGTNSALFLSDCVRLESLLRNLQRGAVARGQHRYVAIWNAEEFGRFEVSGELGEPNASPHSREPSENSQKSGDSSKSGLSSAKTSRSDSGDDTPRMRQEAAGAKRTSTGSPGLRGLHLAVYVRADHAAGFERRDPSRSWLEQTIRPRRLKRLGIVHRFPMLRMVPSLPPPASGPMQRDPVSRFQRLGHPSGLSTLGIPDFWEGRPVYLRRILHFAPDGSSRVEHETTAGTPVKWVELGLWPTWLQPPNLKKVAPEKAIEADARDSPESAQLGSGVAGVRQQKNPVMGLHGVIQISGLNGRVHLFLP